MFRRIILLEASVICVIFFKALYACFGLCWIFLDCPSYMVYNNLLHTVECKKLLSFMKYSNNLLSFG